MMFVLCIMTQPHIRTSNGGSMSRNSCQHTGYQSLCDSCVKIRTVCFEPMSILETSVTAEELVEVIEPIALRPWTGNTCKNISNALLKKYKISRI